MSYKLLIRLKNQDHDAPLFEWITVFDDGSTRVSTSTDSSEELVKLVDAAQQIIVLAPSERILITHVKLPKLSPARLAKAIPFALEDQIIEDAAKLHFAVNNSQRGETSSVAVIEKETMRIWQSALTAKFHHQARKFKVLMPDVLALPWRNGTYHILVDHDLAMVRTGQCSGFTIETDSLFQILNLQLKRPGLVKPDLIEIESPEDPPLFTDEEAAELGVPIKLTLNHHHPLSIMSQTLNEPVLLNLLQGAFAPAQKEISMNQLVWAGFSIVGVWMLFITLTDIASYFILQRTNNAMNNEMKRIYASVYPEAPVPDNPRMKLQSELDNLRANRSDNSFMRLLHIVGPSFASLAENGLMLNGLSYSDNRLLLDVEASDSAVIDQLRQVLAQQGLKVLVNNAERSTGGMIETHFTIEEIH